MRAGPPCKMVNVLRDSRSRRYLARPGSTAAPTASATVNGCVLRARAREREAPLGHGRIKAHSSRGAPRAFPPLFSLRRGTFVLRARACDVRSSLVDARSRCREENVDRGESREDRECAPATIGSARCGGSVVSPRRTENHKKKKKKKKRKGKFKIILTRSRPIDSGCAASCVEINGDERRATRIDIRVQTLKKKALGRGARLSPIMDRRERGNNQRECPSQASTW